MTAHERMLFVAAVGPTAAAVLGYEWGRWQAARRRPERVAERAEAKRRAAYARATSRPRHW